MQKRWQRFAFAVLSVAMVVVTGCGKGAPVGTGGSDPKGTGTSTNTGSNPKSGGTLKVGISRDPLAFDGHIAYGITNSSVLGNVYDGLVEYDMPGDGKIVGALAESWTMPDDKTYSFKIRQGIKFHNGDPFDAHVAEWNLKRIMDPQTAAALRGELTSIIDKIEVPDDYTLKITLKQPSPVFLNVLAARDTYMMDQKWVVAGNDPKKFAMGTGPFKMKSYEPQRNVILVKNESYWKKGLPYLDGLDLEVVQDDAARTNAFKGNEVDFIEYVPWQELQGFESDKSLKLTKGFDTFNIVRLNPNRAPFDNPKVREAMNYVIDRQEIINLAWGGQGQPINGGMLQQSSPYYNADLQGVWKKDWDKARQLLKEAGINNPADVKLTLETSTLAVHKDTAQVVLQELQQFGFKVEYKTFEFQTTVDKRANGDYQMLVDGLGMSWPDPDFYFQYFHSTGSGHAKGVKMKVDAIDKLIEQGRTTVDPAKRKPIYHDLEKQIVENSPWIFLLWRPQAQVTRNFVMGYKPLPGGIAGYSIGYLEYVWLNK
jgi:peptide/nickel transport system substrate-binding protein